MTNIEELEKANNERFLWDVTNEFFPNMNIYADRFTKFGNTITVDIIRTKNKPAYQLTKNSYTNITFNVYDRQGNTTKSEEYKVRLLGVYEVYTSHEYLVDRMTFETV